MVVLGICRNGDFFVRKFLRKSTFLRVVKVAYTLKNIVDFTIKTLAANLLTNFCKIYIVL